MRVGGGVTLLTLVSVAEGVAAVRALSACSPLFSLPRHRLRRLCLVHHLRRLHRLRTVRRVAFTLHYAALVRRSRVTPLLAPASSPRVRAAPAAGGALASKMPSIDAARRPRAGRRRAAGRRAAGRASRRPCYRGRGSGRRGPRTARGDRRDDLDEIDAVDAAAVDASLARYSSPVARESATVGGPGRA